MDVIVDRATLTPGSDAPAFTGPLHKASGSPSLYLIVQPAERPDGLEIRPQKLTGASWTDSGESILPVGDGSRGVLVYPISNPGPGDFRIYASTRSPCRIDVSLVSAEGDAAERPGVVHRIDALGADVARQLPALADAFERLVAVAVRPADPQAGPKSAGQPPVSEAEPVRLPVEIVNFLLSTEIGYQDIAPGDFDQLAQEAGMRSDELTRHIDNVNVLSRTVRLLAIRQEAGAAEAVVLCGFFHTHLDPGHCDLDDVFVCNVLDVHY